MEGKRGLVLGVLGWVWAELEEDHLPFQDVAIKL